MTNSDIAQAAAEKLFKDLGPNGCNRNDPTAWLHVSICCFGASIYAVYGSEDYYYFCWLSELSLCQSMYLEGLSNGFY